MGAVDLVWDTLREEEVARKRCRVDTRGSAGQRALAQLKREFRATAELRHPSLVPVYELGEDAGGLYFTMQAIDGDDLYRWCRNADDSRSPRSDDTTARSPTLHHDPLADTVQGDPATAPTSAAVDPEPSPSALDLDRLARVLPSLFDGLAYLHARGLVHRDLKPSNVLIDSGGSARILDFGVLADLAAPAGEIAGTPAYMAPGADPRRKRLDRDGPVRARRDLVRAHCRPSTVHRNQRRGLVRAAPARCPAATVRAGGRRTTRARPGRRPAAGQGSARTTYPAPAGRQPAARPRRRGAPARSNRGRREQSGRP